ncbi:hypothetical protein [Aeromonas allosaccharophila]
MMAASMAGAGQLVAGDPVHLVALPCQPCQWPRYQDKSRSGRQGGRFTAGPGETVEQLQVIAASMAGAGQLVAGSVDPVH